MEKQKVWGVSDNGFIRLYESEKKAKEEYFAIVQSVKRNTYFHSSCHRDTKIEVEVDCAGTHYIVYTASNGLGGENEYRHAWYQLLTIN